MMCSMCFDEKLIRPEPSCLVALEPWNDNGERLDARKLLDARSRTLQTLEKELANLKLGYLEHHGAL